ncbi:unnamed protein product [Prunus armeniaca]
MVPEKEEKVAEKVCYDMPTKKMSSHLKPLYVGAHFDGVPVSKVLVDMGATVNILPASIMRKLKKGSDELIPTETTVSGFVGDTTTSKGILPLQVRVGQKVRMTAFFVVETTAHFNALLGRDWIHESMCVPSSLHQFLQFWHEDGSVEIVQANVRPFMASTNAVKAKFYEDDIGPLYFTRSNKNDRPTGVSAQKLIDLGAHDAQADGEQEEKKAAVEDTLRWLYGFWAERATEHGSTANLVEFLHEGLEDDALELEKVELAPSEMDDSKAEVQDPLLEINLGTEDNHRPIYISGLMEPELRAKMEELLREFKDCFAWDYTEMPELSRDLVEHCLPTVEDFKPFK